MSKKIISRLFYSVSCNLRAMWTSTYPETEADDDSDDEDEDEDTDVDDEF